jgi:hypothetical protein
MPRTSDAPIMLGTLCLRASARLQSLHSRSTHEGAAIVGKQCHRDPGLIAEPIKAEDCMWFRLGAASFRCPWQLPLAAAINPGHPKHEMTPSTDLPVEGQGSPLYISFPKPVPGFRSPNGAKGYGFIQPVEGGTNLFVHISELACRVRRSESFVRHRTRSQDRADYMRRT